jgi:hypothetical protein
MPDDEKWLLKLYRSLSDADRKSLADYADFLVSRSQTDAPVATTQTVPLDIPRPEHESVIKAVRRLMQTYPMLERDKLLHETTALVTRNVVHKDPAGEVIDELELLFRRHYDVYLDVNVDHK